MRKTYTANFKAKVALEAIKGDRSLAGRYTSTTARHYNKDCPLVPSGLLGPVVLQTRVEP